jgi:hypothetical protein
MMSLQAGGSGMISNGDSGSCEGRPRLEEFRLIEEAEKVANKAQGSDEGTIRVTLNACNEGSCAFADHPHLEMVTPEAPNTAMILGDFGPKISAAMSNLSKVADLPESLYAPLLTEVLKQAPATFLKIVQNVISKGGMSWELSTAVVTGQSHHNVGDKCFFRRGNRRRFFKNKTGKLLSGVS